MPADPEPSEPATAGPESPEPATAPLPPERTSPSLWQVIPWWAVRLAVLAAVPWTLWSLVPPPVTVAVGVSLCLFSLAFLIPWKPLRRPLRVPAVIVLVWDLVLLLLGVACLTVLLPGLPSFLGLILVVVAVVCRLLTRSAGAVSAREAGRVPTTAAVTIATTTTLVLLTPVFPGGVERDLPISLPCAQLRAIPGESSRWKDADTDTRGLPAGGLTGPALWHTDDPGRVVGGSGGTVTLADDTGLLVRSSAEGRVLWHVNAEHALNYFPSYDGVDLVRQIGDTVLLEYHRSRQEGSPSLLIAYDSETGRRAWCEEGPRQVLTDPATSDRFVARVGAPGSGWGLFDAEDGSLIVPLALERQHQDTPTDQERTDLSDLSEPEIRAHLSEGRVTIWSDTALASYDAATGELLTEVGGLRPRARGLVHADDLTVVSSHWFEEGTATVAYSPDGTELWTSGQGSLVGCTPFQAARAFNGHVLVIDHDSEEAPSAALNTENGAVTWVDHEGPEISCEGGWSTIGDRLVSRTGLVIGVEGWEDPVAAQNKAKEVEVTVTANGVAIRSGQYGPVRFHVLP